MISHSAPTSSPESRVSVLIVEDERLVARDIERSLGDMGYEVTGSFATGHNAIRAVESRRPDIVLMDVHIKGKLDGIETADVLWRCHRVPVVYLTAFADVETVARASKTEPYGYLVKPFSVQHLRSAIEIATHKCAADLRMLERERWFSTAIRAVGDAIVIVDSDARIQLMNPLAEELTGWKERNAIGQFVQDIVRFVSDGPEHPASRALRESLSQSPSPETHLLETDGGRSRLVDACASPIFLDGVLMGAVLVLRGVADRVKVADRMARAPASSMDTVTSLLRGTSATSHSRARADSRVDLERAPIPKDLGSLQQLVAELQQQVNELRAQDASRERYVSSVVHDLRGPLSAAKICAQILQGDPRGPEHRAELATMIERALNRADRLAHNWLDAARARARGVFPMVISECDLTSIAGELVEELRAVHGDRFVLRGDAAVCGFWSAEDLRRALWNLATNAVKYGDPSLSITLTVERRPSTVVASVHNYGRPIPPELQANLFEPFLRLEAARPGAPSGWGLGLALVRECIALHGGRVTVQSDDTGTLFTCELPLDARKRESPLESRPGSNPRTH